MDKRTLDRFSKLLRGQRDELQGRLARAKQHSAGTGRAEAKDEGDRATASIASEMSAAQQAKAQSLMRALNAALERFNAGTFGECLNCGQEIELKRLEAIPWARYCLTCQELIDR
jgi:DnaK suppressor protein